jgi:hypothetical protein
MNVVILITIEKMRKFGSVKHVPVPVPISCDTGTIIERCTNDALIIQFVVCIE